MQVAVVGAGPAGALTAFHLARGGVRVDVFDPSHPREKPCGGGLTAKALALLPAAPATEPLPARRVDACRFESGLGASVEISLDQPVAIAARREFDAWLLRRATQAGARHLAQRVVEVRADGTLRTAESEARYDVVVGADGSGSVVRRCLLAPTPPERLTMAAGWYAAGDGPMLVRFTPGLNGYLWLFPRRDHVGVGICAPLRSVPTAQLIGRLEAEVARNFPALADLDGQRYAATIPSPSSRPSSILEIGGENWALVGDAGALADPITGEGIYYALASARLLAETILKDGSCRGYPRAVLDGFGQELLKAAGLFERFYAAGFTDRMIRYAARSRAIRGVLADLVLGDQGYLGLKRRLLRNLPHFAWQSAASLLGAR